MIDDSEFDNDAYSTICARCKHLKSSTDRTCKAFPKGIPSQIWNGENDHTKPFKGDSGTRFEHV